jgi:hypothetical protein
MSAWLVVQLTWVLHKTVRLALPLFGIFCILCGERFARKHSIYALPEVGIAVIIHVLAVLCLWFSQVTKKQQWTAHSLVTG